MLQGVTIRFNIEVTKIVRRDRHGVALVAMLANKRYWKWQSSTWSQQRHRGLRQNDFCVPAAEACRLWAKLATLREGRFYVV